MIVQFSSGAQRPGGSEHQLVWIDLWLECFPGPGFRKGAANNENQNCWEGCSSGDGSNGVGSEDKRETTGWEWKGQEIKSLIKVEE